MCRNLWRLTMLQVFCHSMRTIRLLRRNTRIVRVSNVRHLNLLEYQSKELLRDSGVSVQNFAIVDDLTKTNSALKKLHANEFVIKAQVLAGGRG
ncbi:succinate--CoA ligase [GDP-forming] subunit beta, mitochondrial-like [Monomorium pharaonis]|uniref:succinate--CoA ligase [GDP-forming] subunit beta, mitochondrial-like n=1 Tax=Monomorium pharaonis TaxID=307658 RepID=UPI00174797E7|nr:succinate--CoA ligase [GDP-forming] subunit beta, mitochondrial-like [Monomorium pharaonis]